MEKVYKTRIYRIITNLLNSVLGAFAVGWISSLFLSMPYPYIIGVLIFVVSFILLVLDCMISISIKNNKMIVKKRGRILHTFNIDECGFHAATSTSFGDTECALIVITADGNKTIVDCELIGQSNFEKLLEDLGIIGDNAFVINLKTTKK